MAESAAAVMEPEQAVTVEREFKRDQKPKRQPRYHVILWDDPNHSYDYVVRMMYALFGHSYERGYQIAKEVDTKGRAVCLTTTREHAELKRDQIQAFGNDPMSSKAPVGSMYASIEPDLG